jgi:hypothetical protein
MPWKLIHEMQDHSNPLVIGAEVVFQLLNEMDTGDIDLGEPHAGRRRSRNEPPLFDPELQRFNLAPEAVAS